LDPVKLADVLRVQAVHNLVLTQREQAPLLEIVEVLEPLAETTELCQSQHYTTIGSIVPCIVSLHKFLTQVEQQCKFHRPMVVALKESLHQGFCRMLSRLHILTQSNTASSVSHGGIW